MKPVPLDRQLARAGFETLPALIAAAGDRAAWRFIEFFTANIRNPNTRRAYGRAVGDFFRWCEARRIRDINRINPTIVATFVEQRGQTRAKPSVKQELAAVRMLFDWLGLRCRAPWSDLSNNAIHLSIGRESKTIFSLQWPFRPWNDVVEPPRSRRIDPWRHYLRGVVAGLRVQTAASTRC